MRSAEEHVGLSFYPHECGSMIECITKQDAIKAIREAQREAIVEASEVAKTIKTGNSGSWFDASVDKQSILQLLNQIQ